MYEYFKNNALKYYNPDGDLSAYRFKRTQLLNLVDELEKNNEIILGIVVLLNPSEHKYGNACGFFNTDSILKNNLSEFIKKSYARTREYIKKINEENDKIYYEITLESQNLKP